MLEAVWGLLSSSSRQHGLRLLLKRPRLWFAAARCAVCDSGLPQFISVGDEREKLGGRNQADIGGLSLPLSHAVLKKTPPPCTCSASSCRRLAGVEPLASERTSLSSLLDRRCFEHDFDVQPGFPPSGRKSVNDFGRHDVSNPTIDKRFALVSLRNICDCLLRWSSSGRVGRELTLA